jgi:hypothetical protein
LIADISKATSIGFCLELVLLPIGLLVYYESTLLFILITQAAGIMIAEVVSAPIEKALGSSPGWGELVRWLVIVVVNALALSAVVLIGIRLWRSSQDRPLLAVGKNVPVRQFSAGNIAGHANDVKDWVTAVLQKLSADAAAQRSFVDPNNPANLNPLASEFDEVFKLFSGIEGTEMVSDAQSRALRDVHQQVGRVRDLGLLSLEGLESTEWQKVRDLALVALRRFNLSGK